MILILQEDFQELLGSFPPYGLQSSKKLIPVTVNRGKNKECVGKCNNSLSEKASKLCPESPHVSALQKCLENLTFQDEKYLPEWELKLKC